MSLSANYILYIYSSYPHTLPRYLKKGDRLALLLDYDGTLSPLADHPDNTVMEPESEAALHRLAANTNVFLAIISGRAPADARKKVAMSNITYAGNHGLEIHYPNGTKWQYQVSDEVKRNYAKLVDLLEKKVMGGSTKASYNG